jgi:DNA invertase Pin-like site-specific DNA recombinase
MLEIENGNVTELHVHSIDRLGKNTIDILSTINLITSYGCKCCADKERITNVNCGEEKSIAK